jgi:hypothetical protein
VLTDVVALLAACSLLALSATSLASSLTTTQFAGCCAGLQPPPSPLLSGYPALLVGNCLVMRLPLACVLLQHSTTPLLLLLCTWLHVPHADRFTALSLADGSSQVSPQRNGWPLASSISLPAVTSIALARGLLPHALNLQPDPLRSPTHNPMTLHSWIFCSRESPKS